MLKVPRNSRVCRSIAEENRESIVLGFPEETRIGDLTESHRSATDRVVLIESHDYELDFSCMTHDYGRQPVYNCRLVASGKFCRCVLAWLRETGKREFRHGRWNIREFDFPH